MGACHHSQQQLDHLQCQAQCQAQCQVPLHLVLDAALGMLNIAATQLTTAMDPQTNVPSVMELGAQTACHHTQQQLDHLQFQVLLQVLQVALVVHSTPVSICVLLMCLLLVWKVAKDAVPVTCSSDHEFFFCIHTK